MADIIFIAITLGFFALCALYVNWCDRIIGVDEFGSSSAPASPETPDPTSTEPHREMAA